MFRVSAFSVLLLLSAPAGAEEITSVELGGRTYGAQADESGPIGGGSGYAPVVTHGDLVAENLDQLLEALAQAMPGQIFFIPARSKTGFTSPMFARHST